MLGRLLRCGLLWCRCPAAAAASAASRRPCPQWLRATPSGRLLPLAPAAAGQIIMPDPAAAQRPDPLARPCCQPQWTNEVRRDR